MGRRLRKKDLLHEIRLERAALDATLSLLTPRQMTNGGAPGRGPGPRAQDDVVRAA